MTEARRGHEHLTRTAIVLGSLSVLGWCLAGRYAYAASRGAIIQKIYDSNVSIAATLAGAAGRFKVSGSCPEPLAELEVLWRDTRLHYPGTYLCVVLRDGRLGLHTARPEDVGRNVGGNILPAAKDGEPGNVQELVAARQDYVGPYVSSAGDKQIAAFVYARDLDAIVAVHVPEAAMDDEVRAAAMPWMTGLGFMMLLVPAALGLLHRACSSSRRAEILASRYLLESEERYRRLVELSPETILVQSGGRVVFVNRAGARLLGAEEGGQLVGRHVLELLHPDYHEIGRARLESLARGEAVPLIEEKLIRIDGKEVDVEVAAVPFPDGDRSAVQVIARDITERKQAARALAERADLATLGAKVGAAMIQRHALPDTLRRSTDAMVQHLGAILARIWTLNRGQEVLELQASSGTDTTIHGSNGRVRVGEHEIGLIARERKPHVTSDAAADPRLRDQAWARHEGMTAFAGYPLLVEDRLAGVMAIFARKPLTQAALEAMSSIANVIAVGIERKWMETELEDAREAAEASNRAKSQFLATMSHELRTPLNGVIGMTDLVLDTEITAEQKQHLETVRASSAALLSVVEDVLEFSELDTRKLKLRPAPFDPRKSLAQALKPFVERARLKHLTLDWTISPDVPARVTGDAGCLNKICARLVGNAIKFTEAGAIHVGIDAESSGNDGVRLHFTVEDTGIGIPAEKHREIFEAFSQADGSPTRKYGGIGLGLTIASELARKMGGRMWVESEVGKGSVFHFTACLQAEAVAAA